MGIYVDRAATTLEGFAVPKLTVFHRNALRVALQSTSRVCLATAKDTVAYYALGAGAVSPVDPMENRARLVGANARLVGTAINLKALCARPNRAATKAVYGCG